MSKLYYTYSTMSAGKSMEILKVAHNYEVQGKPVMVLTSVLDERFKKGMIWSRTGFSRKADIFDKETNIINLVAKKKVKPHCLLVDEAQFLNKEQVLQLTELADEHNIKVMCYGLKNDSFNELFEGSKYLLLYADDLEELETECWYCHYKAIMNLRFDSKGFPIYEGSQVDIGGDEKYLPVCRKHYKSVVKFKEPIESHKQVS